MEDVEDPGDVSREEIMEDLFGADGLSDDGNQFCRLVREALTELDLPYTLVSVGKESPRRADLAALSGRSTAPYLVDANTCVAMGESADICAYLYREYSA